LGFLTPTRRTFLRGLTAATFLARHSKAQIDAPRIFNIKRYGALGDGVTIVTPAIQRAIDAASLPSGGIVTVPPGRYVTGTLRLKSSVTLRLDEGATLLGSLNPSDYQLVEPFTDGVGTARGYALIACVDVHNVAIVGSGTIDGRGAELQATIPGKDKPPAARPFLVLCVRSTELKIQQVKLLNSSAWTMHLFQCSGVTVDRVSIRSLGLANNDGIDIDSSSNVSIDQCTIETGDDAICLKTTSSKPCRDIAVANCTMTTRCAAFKIGTESAGDFSNIRVTGCHVVLANLGAVKLLSVDGAHISNVLVEAMRVDDADTPIFLRLGARGRTFRPGDTALPAGTLSGITIRDMQVARARRIGILIAGLPGHPIEDIALDNISIALTGDAVAQIPPEPAELPAAYPEVRMFGAALPAFGLYGRHLRNLRMASVKITGPAGDARPKQLLLDDRA
jgi:polygalacturonase